MFKLLKLLLLPFLIASCTTTKKSIDIPYIKSSKALVESFPKLDVYQPAKSDKRPVVIFVHGGNWNAGNKEIYKFLGRNFAKKDLVTVIPSYTLSPDGNYNTMTMEVAEAIKWTHENIEKHGGNPDEIFLMGHSAGAHLVALVATNPKYLENVDLIKGIILNDAGGLDMYSYLQENPPNKNGHYDVTWTENEENWKDASPIYFLSEKTPPILIFTGTKTYPSIIAGSKDFVQKLNRYQPEVEINYFKKKHVPMMRQMFFPGNKLYKKIVDFIDIQK